MNDVSLNVPHGEELTVGRLRQFLGNADRLGLPDDTVVICTAIMQTGRIGNLQTQVGKVARDAAKEG